MYSASEMAGSQGNDAYLRNALSKYQYPDLAQRDILQAFSHFKDLRPNVDSFVFNDGNRKELLCLAGTIPVTYKGTIYNIPVCVWLLETHPYNPPVVNVKPTATMQIKPGQYVDANGRVYLPFLFEWRHPQSDLLGLIQIMCIIFGETPPVFTKKAEGPTPRAGCPQGGLSYPLYMHPVIPSLPTPSPLSPPTNAAPLWHTPVRSQPKTTIVALHRSTIQQDMLSLFMEPTIIDMKLMVTFIGEKGADGQGLSRDAYCAFWKEFFTSACGEYERVPLLSPKYGQDEWKAVGRILLKGYIDCGVYPLQLSLAFSVAVIFGERSVSSDMLLQSFRMYLPEADRKVVDKALCGEVLDEDEQDDLLDLLSRVGCNSIPKKEHMRNTVLRMAHKELIQEPKYALDAMAETVCGQLQMLFPDVQKLRLMYENKTPTARKVINLLNCTPANKEQSDAFGYLKQFIKGLDNAMLKKFLRYFTGADLICTSHIDISFNRMVGLARAPQAHTCGPLIELPCTYRSYTELRQEFMAILESDYLKMDIV
ncbi:uncharacterized protein LOC106158870 [Lingula anatina]|uniref:Uncharacterized protein LOC106158870 n=1 Tax=Lingula anatina TaxID=7574 RepID=A0A1S3HXZ7_LINAN|nr:uncharacterized protein LOC106158870 [Lingula anatina]|eukprot:XP_013390436.1 uncharacterized protein LOC106158870 [Lingula anatina]